MINIEKYKGKIIFDKCIEYLFLHAKNVYWFINDYSMYYLKLYIDKKSGKKYTKKSNF